MRSVRFSMSAPRSRKIMKFVAWTALALLLGAAGAFAQKPAATPKPTGTPIEDNAGSTKVFEVRLPVTVYDPRVKKPKSGLVTSLSKNDFEILEDGVPQEVTFFSDEKSNPPVYVGVLMDTSPSTAGKPSF